MKLREEIRMRLFEGINDYDEVTNDILKLFEKRIDYEFKTLNQRFGSECGKARIEGWNEALYKLKEMLNK